MNKKQFLITAVIVVMVILLASTGDEEGINPTLEANTSISPAISYLDTVENHIVATAKEIPETDEFAEPELKSEEIVENFENSNETYLITRVIDGDTIEVIIDNKKETVRYIGVDTPETVHPSKPVQCFGLEASNKNKELVAGKRVKLVKDISNTDKYGRLLRYVYVDDIFVNLKLVEEGFANASSYPPDVKHNELFRQAEQKARAGKIGLWGDTCSNNRTQTTTIMEAKQTYTSSIQNTPTDNKCTIKGNINSKGEKIYHLTSCQSYTKTIIDEANGEKWFCTEKEASEAGWRKALNC